MLFSNIKPFVRYIHYIPMDTLSGCIETVPYDNRLFFVYNGNGQISVNEKIHKINTNSVIIIPAGTKYQLLPSDGKITYIAVNFDYTFDYSYKSVPIPPVEPTLYNPTMCHEKIHFDDITFFNNTVYIENMLHINDIFLKIYNEYSRKMIFYENIISDLFSEILLQCAREAHTSVLSSNSEKINPIIDYINENYSKKLTNKHIGDSFNLHPNYINSLFKAFTGMSLHRFILQTRLSVATKLLMSKRYSIGEISEKCGFSDIYHFSKAFKEFTGTPPSKYCQ